jgi:orotidine-5'-phosphate decarboxylase
MNKNVGLLVNSSRAIIYASQTSDLQKLLQQRNSAREMATQMAVILS